MDRSPATREELIARILNLSEEEFARVAPHIEADLDWLPRLEDMLEEIRLGRLGVAGGSITAKVELLRRIDERLGRS